MQRCQWVPLLTLALLLGCFSSCRKKEPTTWDADFHLPLLETRLTLNDLVADSMLSSDEDGMAHLNFRQQLYEMSFDSLFTLPDTISEHGYKSPFGNVVFSPGQLLFSRKDTIQYDPQHIELVHLVLREGTFTYEMTNTIRGRLVVSYEFLKVDQKNGEPFIIQGEIPAGTPSSPGKFKGTVDISGYDLDMTGPSGGKVNYLETLTKVKISPDEDNTTIQSGDQVRVKGTFEGMVPEFARGYFGQQEIDIPPSSVKTELFSSIQGGMLDIDGIDIDLILNNGIGTDARITLNELSARNSRTNKITSLDHSVLGTPLNISRANQEGGQLAHQEKTVHLNEQNSNVDKFIETLPDSLSYDLSLLINPLGNVSSGNDIAQYGHGFEAALDINLPLRIGMSDLTLQDTIAFETGEQKGGFQEGTFKVHVENTFPLEAQLRLFFLKNGNITDTLFAGEPIRAASSPSSVQPRTSTLTAPVPPEKASRLKDTDELLLKVGFTSQPGGQIVPFYSKHNMKIQVTGEFRQRLSVGKKVLP